MNKTKIKQYINMGNYLYTTNSLEQEVESLKSKIDHNNDNLVTKDELDQYFKSLSNKIDHNNDGLISKEELEQYVDSKDKDVEKWKSMYEQELLKAEILQEEVDRLKTYLNFATGLDEIERHSFISSKCISDYIEENIVNTDANLKYLPDAVERKVYYTLYKTSLESLEQMCNTTTLSVMNHKIKLSIEPDYGDDE